MQNWPLTKEMGCELSLVGLTEVARNKLREAKIVSGVHGDLSTYI